MKPDDKHPDRTPITIDDSQFLVEEDELTGSELRALPEPDVPGTRDLWLDVHGPNDDILIDLTKKVSIEPGMHFYTAPSTINPGGCHCGTA